MLGRGPLLSPAWVRDASRLTFHVQSEMHLIITSIAEEDATVTQLHLLDGEAACGALAAHQQPPTRTQHLSVFLPLCCCCLRGQPGHQRHTVPLQHLQWALCLFLVDNAHGLGWGCKGQGRVQGSGVSLQCGTGLGWDSCEQRGSNAQGESPWGRGVVRLMAVMVHIQP